MALMIKCTNVTVVRAVASHQCGPGLRLTLVLSVAPRGFSPGTLVFPSNQFQPGTIEKEPLCACVTSQSFLLFIYLFTSLLYL